MAGALPAGRKSKVERIEDTKVIYPENKVELLKKFPKLKDAIARESKKGWREIVVQEDGGFNSRG